MGFAGNETLKRLVAEVGTRKKAWGYKYLWYKVLVAALASEPAEGVLLRVALVLPLDLGILPSSPRLRRTGCCGELGDEPEAASGGGE